MRASTAQQCSERQQAVIWLAVRVRHGHGRSDEANGELTAPTKESGFCLQCARLA